MIYVAVIGLAVWAALYVGRNLARQAKGCPCGGCGGCNACSRRTRERSK